MDPFSRRATAPIMVSNTNHDTKMMIKGMLKDRYTEDIDDTYEVKAFPKGNPNDKKDKEKNTHSLIDNGDDLYR